MKCSGHTHVGAPFHIAVHLSATELLTSSQDVIRASYDADDEDACGSDNEKDTGLTNGKKKTGRKAGTEAEVTPAAVAMRRASAAGSSRSDGGLGTGLPAPPAPPVTGRSSGGLFSNNRLGSQRSLWGSFEDNVIPVGCGSRSSQRLFWWTK